MNDRDSSPCCSAAGEWRGRRGGPGRGFPDRCRRARGACPLAASGMPLRYTMRLPTARRSPSVTMPTRFNGSAALRVNVVAG
jgi:hypothetical protein